MRLRFHLPQLRPYQAPALVNDVQDQVIVSAPQLGKTYLARYWLLVRGLRHGADPRPWWWTAPTYFQAKHGFGGLVQILRGAGLVTSKDYTTSPPLECRVPGGPTFQARSWDNPQGMYGPTVLGGVADEFGWLTPPAYSAMSSRRAETIAQGFGQWLWIGNVGEMGGAAEDIWRVAEGGAAGFAHSRWTWRDRAMAHECSCLADIPIAIENADEHQLTCPQGIYLRFLANERSRMSDPQFRQLYDAEWVDWNLLPAYSSFDRAVNVNADRSQRSPHLPLDLCCDFNVDPMAWTIGQHKGEDSWTFDEIGIPGGATTAKAAEEFVHRYASARVSVEIYGDASGKYGSTKSKHSDYDILRKALAPHFKEVRMMVPASNPAVAARLNAANARLRSAAGEVRHYLHPRCKKLADDYARVSLKAGTHDIDKSNKNLTHYSDADTYRLARLYPVDKASRPPVVVTQDRQFTDPMLGSF